MCMQTNLLLMSLHVTCIYMRLHGGKYMYLKQSRENQSSNTCTKRTYTFVPVYTCTYGLNCLDNGRDIEHVHQQFVLSDVGRLHPTCNLSWSCLSRRAICLIYGKQLHRGLIATTSNLSECYRSLLQICQRSGCGAFVTSLDASVQKSAVRISNSMDVRTWHEL